MLQGILNQVEAVDLVLHAHIERRGDGAFLLVAMDRQVAVGTLVGQLMDQGRVTMECEDDRLILGEQSIVISVRQAMRMLGVGLKLHQVNNVDNADLQFGHSIAQDGDSSQSFQGRGITAAGHDDIRLFADAGAVGESQSKANPCHGCGKCGGDVVVLRFQSQAVGFERTSDQVTQHGILAAEDALMAGDFLHRDAEPPGLVHAGLP